MIITRIITRAMEIGEEDAPVELPDPDELPGDPFGEPAPETVPPEHAPVPAREPEEVPA